jgi:hypothetical protein
MHVQRPASEHSMPSAHAGHSPPQPSSPHVPAAHAGSQSPDEHCPLRVLQLSPKSHTPHE